MRNHPVDLKSRRQFLAAAAALGVTPWLLSAIGAAAAVPAPGTGSAARRRLGPFEVFPIGLAAMLGEWLRGWDGVTRSVREGGA